jgi:hypothetical protein
MLFIPWCIMFAMLHVNALLSLVRRACLAASQIVSQFELSQFELSQFELS